MLLNELFSSDTQPLCEGAKRVWSRKGNVVVKKFRCTSGRKKGRLVAKPAECGAPVDMEKRRRMRQLMMAKGKRMRRKASKVRRLNPTSKRIQKMNKQNA